MISYLLQVSYLQYVFLRCSSINDVESPTNVKILQTVEPKNVQSGVVCVDSCNIVRVVYCLCCTKESLCYLTLTVVLFITAGRDCYYGYQDYQNVHKLSFSESKSNVSYYCICYMMKQTNNVHCIVLPKKMEQGQTQVLRCLQIVEQFLDTTTDNVLAVMFPAL